MKPILLIYPPFEGKTLLKSREPFPIGLLYLSAYLKVNGIETKILDFGYPFEQTHADKPSALIAKQRRYIRYGASNETIREELKKALKESNNIVGVSSLMSATYNGAYDVIKIIKELAPDKIVVVGGPHATAFPDHVLMNTEADYICIGEGEKTFLEFIKAGKSSHIIGCLPDIPGDKICKIENMDDLPFPDRDMLPGDRKIEEMVVTFSRGCPHKCSFCGSHLVQGRQWRHKSVERVIEEIKYYVENWGIKKFSIEDDNLAPGKEGIAWLKSICQNIIKLYEDKTLPKLKFHVPHGIPVYAIADKELCGLLWDAGFRGMVFPLESTNPATLKDMKKEFTPKFYDTAIGNWGKYERPFPTEIIIGYPFVDTIESMLNTMLDIAGKGGLVWASHFRLNKGTELYERCLSAGYIDNSYDPINTQSFFIETERFKIEDLAEIIAIGRALNFGTEKGFNFIHDPISKLDYSDYRFDLESNFGIGGVVATGKFAFNRSQKGFTNLILCRQGALGKPVLSMNKEKTEITREGSKISKVYSVLAELLDARGILVKKKNIMSYFGKDK